MKKIAIIVSFCFVFLFTAYAQWSTDPSNNLIVGYGLLPEIASDNAGGCYITYEQNTAYPRRLILERLNKYGYKPWGSSKRITGLLPEQAFAKITEDGHNGVIISYHDIEVTGDPHNPVITDRLRVQRVDSSGNFLWELTGVRVTISETIQGDQAIVSDGQGGCIVAWMEGGTVLAQRVDSSGMRVWGDSGIVLDTRSQYAPKIIKTYVDKFVVAYGAQLKKIDAQGNILWGGQPVNVGFGTRSIISDNSCGVIVYDGTGTSSNILIVTQKIDSLGTFVWNSPYIILDDSAIFNVLGNPFSLNADGSATYAWAKDFAGLRDLRTQIVRSDGSTVFPFGGIPVSRITSSKGIVAILPSDSATSVYVWFDQRTVRGTYTQRLDTLGNHLWDTLDVLVSVPDLTYEKIVTDGQGGFIIVGSRENFSIRAQQVNKYGQLGQIITSIGENNTQLPTEFILYQNYPNPFNTGTTIQYDLPRKTWVRLDIFNVMGQHIQILRDQIQNPGTYEVIFDASRYPSGIYFYRLMTNETIQVRKFTILK